MFEQLTNKFKLPRILLFRIFPIRHFIWSLGLGEPQFSRIEEEINGLDTMANSSPEFCSLLVFANLIPLYSKWNKSKWELGLVQPAFEGNLELPDHKSFYNPKQNPSFFLWNVAKIGLQEIFFLSNRQNLWLYQLDRNVKSL